MSIDYLNQQFAVPKRLIFNEINKGFPVIEVLNDNAEATVSLYGGQVLSYRPTEQSHDVLFMAGKAQYLEGKAIRGGIPVCWPWFGKRPDRPDFPGHGIARINRWSVAEAKQLDAGNTQIRLSLKQPLPQHLNWWPHGFELQMMISIGKKLILELITHNTSRQPFTVTQAFHGYFRIGDIKQCRLTGLENIDYLDNLDGARQKRRNDALTVSNAIEQVYQLNNGTVNIVDAILKRKIAVRSFDATAMVVWNPWTTGAAAMPDLNETDFQNFICVEPGHIGATGFELPPESERSLRTVIEVESTE